MFILSVFGVCSSAVDGESGGVLIESSADVGEVTFATFSVGEEPGGVMFPVSERGVVVVSTAGVLVRTGPVIVFTLVVVTDDCGEVTLSGAGVVVLATGAVTPGTLVTSFITCVGDFTGEVTPGREVTVIDWAPVEGDAIIFALSVGMRNLKVFPSAVLFSMRYMS